MDQEYVSTKIKDGLFIANKETASDLEFLTANRFKYILNCTSQVKNYFQTSHHLIYHKLNYSKQKPGQLLWKDNLKKLDVILDFIDTAENEAESCLIHSNEGNNRCIVIVIAYLMRKYKWKISKVIQFLESKDAQIQVTENYMNQLKVLEEKLAANHSLSQEWTKENIMEDELVMTNTYLNSIQITFQKMKKHHKTTKKVLWKDKIQEAEKIENQERNRKTKLKSEKEKVQKSYNKSEILETKKQQPKQAMKNRQKQQKFPRSSSSITRSYTKFIIDSNIACQVQKRYSEGEDNSSTQDIQHNNRLLNNFSNFDNEPKRTSKMAPHKFEESINMTRAFSEKELSTSKHGSNRNTCMNSSKQSLKASTKSKQTKGSMKEQGTLQPLKCLRSIPEGKMRATSPKSSIRYKN